MSKRNIKLNIGALTLGLAFSIGALAEEMSKDSYQSSKAAIVAEYKAARSACDSQSGNYKDICIAQAKGRESVGLAELKAQYQPSPKTQHEARVAKIEADYTVAKEECDSKANNAKDVCVKEAQAAEAAAKANATAAMK